MTTSEKCAHTRTQKEELWNTEASPTFTHRSYASPSYLSIFPKVAFLWVDRYTDGLSADAGGKVTPESLNVITDS